MIFHDFLSPLFPSKVSSSFLTPCFPGNLSFSFFTPVSLLSHLSQPFFHPYFAGYLYVHPRFRVKEDLERQLHAAASKDDASFEALLSQYLGSNNLEQLQDFPGVELERFVIDEEGSFDSLWGTEDLFAAQGEPPTSRAGIASMPMQPGLATGRASETQFPPRLGTLRGRFGSPNLQLIPFRSGHDAVSGTPSPRPLLGTELSRRREQVTNKEGESIGVEESHHLGLGTHQPSRLTLDPEQLASAGISPPHTPLSGLTFEFNPSYDPNTDHLGPISPPELPDHFGRQREARQTDRLTLQARLVDQDRFVLPLGIEPRAAVDYLLGADLPGLETFQSPSAHTIPASATWGTGPPAKLPVRGKGRRHSSQSELGNDFPGPITRARKRSSENRDAPGGLLGDFTQQEQENELSALGVELDQDRLFPPGGESPPGDLADRNGGVMNRILSRISADVGPLFKVCILELLQSCFGPSSRQRTH